MNVIVNCTSIKERERERGKKEKKERKKEKKKERNSNVLWACKELFPKDNYVNKAISVACNHDKKCSCAFVSVSERLNLLHVTGGWEESSWQCTTGQLTYASVAGETGQYCWSGAHDLS